MAGLTLLLIIVLAAGVLAIYWLLNRSRTEAEKSRFERERPPVEPQELSPLAQPYKNLLGEAVTIQQEVARRGENAPAVLKNEIQSMAHRMFQLVQRALPRARHGTDLTDFLLRLTPDDPEYASNRAEADEIAAELGRFVEQLRRVRGKVYGILSNAASLHADRRLQTDLDDALADVQSLEEAMSEAVQESAYLP